MTYHSSSSYASKICTVRVRARIYLTYFFFPHDGHSFIGIYRSGLFRDLPNRQRHHELSTLFDTPPAFGKGMSLRAESTADICVLLLTYLKELPEPVLTPYLFNAFWNWCVRPSVKREDECMRKEQDEEECLHTRFFQTSQRPPRSSSRVLYEKARLREAQDETDKTGQVTVAKDLLRLLPTHSFSLIVYLCAFFTQVPLCPENGITFEDIGRIFGPPRVWITCARSTSHDGVVPQALESRIGWFAQLRYRPGGPEECGWCSFWVVAAAFVEMGYARA
jgi:RhoGAP domain